MRTLVKAVSVSLVLIPLTATTVFAATSTGSNQNHIANAQSRFLNSYQKNEQREQVLLQQAQQIQNPNSTQYQGFVNTVDTQVASLLSSEKTLFDLGFTWGTDIKGRPNPTIVHEDQALKARLREDLVLEKKHPEKTPAQRRNLSKIRASITQLEHEIPRLNFLIKEATVIRTNSDAKYFSQNVSALMSNILNLQLDEIRVTKTWIASGKTSVTGSVYGTNANGQPSSN